MHLKPRQHLRPLSPLLLSFALGCAGPAPEQDTTTQASDSEASRLPSASKHSLPPGLEPSLVKDLQVGEQFLATDVNSSRALAPPAVTASGEVYFAAHDGNNGSALWKTDGTPEGTRLVRQFFTRTGFGLIMDWLTAVGDTVYFTVNDEQPGSRLFKSDGTPEGTVELQQPESGPLLRPSELTACNGRVFFHDPTGLWTLEGSPERPVQLAPVPIYPGPIFEGQRRRVVCAEGTLFFLDTSSNSQESSLWKSDGTPEGTVPLLSIGYVWDWRSPLLLTSGPRVFVQTNELWQITLWKSDGTAAGTVLLRDVLPGHESSGAGLTPFVPVGHRGTFAFSASDGVSGLELWTSDGSPEGTRRFADVHEGPASAAPLQLTVSGSRLFFVANGGEHGRELWSVKQAAFHPQP